MVETYRHAAASVPQTPRETGRVETYIDPTTGKWSHMDTTGRVNGILSRNDATASQGPGFATDTYVAGASLQIPACGMKAGQKYRVRITASKTAAGTAAAVYTLRLGAAGTVADTAILALTAGAQTAAADNGTLFVDVSVRSVSATGVVAGAASWAKTQAGTAGLGGSIDGVSSTFDNSAVAGQFLGLSINGGASAAWTITSVSAELVG